MPGGGAEKCAEVAEVVAGPGGEPSGAAAAAAAQRVLSSSPGGFEPLTNQMFSLQVFKVW